MSSLDKLFANSLKNDITHSFVESVESVEAIMFLEGVSCEDFLKSNKVTVYSPVMKDNFSFRPTKLAFTDQYENVETHYDILSVWLYKLSENLRRLYSANKKSNDTSSLIEQQNNLYTISNYFMDFWDTHNEGAFFPRSIFGRHSYDLNPIDYLIYLGTHDCLSQTNFDNHLKLVNKLSPKIEYDYIPDFIPKLALSSTNSKLLKTILPHISPDNLISTLNYHKSSDGFKILSFEYILENQHRFALEPFNKTDLIRNFIRDDVLFSKHFDDFILDKNAYLDRLSQFITPEISKEIEVLLTHKISKTNITFLINLIFKKSKKSNPASLFKDLSTLSFEEINSSYELTPQIISDTISHVVYQASLKNFVNKESMKNNFRNLVDKLHPVLTKEHLATIISFDSEFISFCKPVYLHIKLNEKINENLNNSSIAVKRNKI